MSNNFNRTTEASSLYHDIEKMDTSTILNNINTEDKKVAGLVEKQIPQISLLIDAAANKLQNGGRLFYIGAGTSGRLGMVDASECPPTFGVSEDVVVGIIAGGQKAMFHAVENAEDVYGMMEDHCKETVHLYNNLLSRGVAPEIARSILPQSMYTEFIETASLAGYARLYKLRTSPDAQREIQQYARAIGIMLETKFPISWRALTSSSE